MVTDFRIEEATEEDIAAIIALVVPSFDQYEIERYMGNVNTPEGRAATAQRHLHAWRQHKKDFSGPCAIKCIHTDPTTQEQTLVGFAEWFIYDHPLSTEQVQQGHYLQSASWLPEEDGRRAQAQHWNAPVLDTRRRWLGGRPHGLLMYMCVDEAWRRRGVSTMCVQWGLDRCRDLKIPAYLEASEAGEHVYRRLGFEVVDHVSIDMHGSVDAFPAMMWWPPGTREEEKSAAGI